MPSKSDKPAVEGDLKPIVSIDALELPGGAVLTRRSDTRGLRFRVFLNGQEGARLLTYADFEEWLALYSIDPSSVVAAAAESGWPIETPDGVVRFSLIEG